MARGNPAEKRPASGDELHVIPAPSGGWAVKRSGHPSPIERFEAREDALAYAYDQVGREAVVVHSPEEWLHSLEDDGKVLRFGRPEEAKPTFGSARGLVSLAEDFDEPLEDFSEYMP